MRKKVTITLLCIVAFIGLFFYLNSKIVHHDHVEQGEIIEKYEKEEQNKTKYLIKVKGVEPKLIVKDKNAWNLIKVGEKYYIDYKWSKAHPHVVAYIGEHKPKGKSGH